MKTNGEEPSVWVRRQWNDSWRARYRLSDLEYVHWRPRSLDPQEAAKLPGLYGYVWCHAMLEGESSRSERDRSSAQSRTHALCPYNRPHGKCPPEGAIGSCTRRTEVCIIRRDNDPDAFRRLVEKAGPKPKR